jgi:hypothetical protein
MHAVDWLGIAGSLLVFASFWMKSTIPLRTLALASNVLFIAYGYVAWLIPILVLHCALLPLNLMRLRQLHRQQKANDNERRRMREAVTLAAAAGQDGTAQRAMHRTEGSVSEAF